MQVEVEEGMEVMAATQETVAAAAAEDMALTEGMALLVPEAAAEDMALTEGMAVSMPAVAAADMVQRGMEDVITHASFLGSLGVGQATGKMVETAYAL